MTSAEKEKSSTGLCRPPLSPAADPGRAMKVLLLVGLGALFFAYYWDDNFDPASLQGARVLLTGASVGIGEELAYHYARLGSHLVLTAHTEALLQKVVGNCRKLGAPKVFYIAADMASPEVPERVVQFALDKLGGLDYLVMNHLGAAPAGTRGRSAQATRWLMQVNFLSYVQLTSLALPSLTDSKGSLVVVSSLLGGETEAERQMDVIQEVRDGRKCNRLWAKGYICSTKNVVCAPIMIACIRRYALDIHDIFTTRG
ncbi:hydroxysteroid 11-beta-dehydrogenase 1-like protein isoform X3 [Orcinus orca]|uniref:hydroxysteroid 11-beta-dehydrogenase 1-like protein isoform X3 n=1 Tax=Orcinus orca TaxID=9733 RepID=UPI00211139A7|nr:hydroxysteroid 11-beta-dehydrogenase 1-like protein isoform X3 [Orcinus orca]